jgi:thiol:disulfide interchange protein
MTFHRDLSIHLRPLRLATCAGLLAAIAGGCYAPATPRESAESRAPIYNPAADAKADVAAALVKAKQDHKRVLVMFGGNWCIWCHRLHGVLLKDAEIASIVQRKYELIMVDVNNNKPLLADYDKGREQHGYPFLTILDADGRVLVNQETDVLEKDKGYDIEKVKTFLLKWAP